MLPRQRFFASLCLLLLALAGCAYLSFQVSAKKSSDASLLIQTPSVVLDSSATLVTVCPADSSQSTARVQLIARATDPQGNPLRYTWSTSGGQIIGDGANTTWDLSSVRPGVYTAQVEVSRGSERDCLAFTSTAVKVTECTPVCPNISISCPGANTLGQPVTFTANVTGGSSHVTPIYNWKISAGTITNGQGTPSITVETTGLAGQSITATLEVGGYNLDCSATCVMQVAVRVERRKFDEFGNINRDDEKARLDNFAIQLQQEQDAQGYVIVYSGRRSRPDDAQRRANRAKEYLVNNRGIDPRRIVTLVGGAREDLTVELWIVPTGATPPPLRP